MHIQFYIRFNTSYGQSLWINTINDFTIHPVDKAIPMTYINEELWHAEIKVNKEQCRSFKYKYILKNENGEILPEYGNDRAIGFSQNGIKEMIVIDTWNHAGEYENIFYTAPFKKTLLKQNDSVSKLFSAKKATHIFKIKAPLLQKDECICMAGNCKTLGSWSADKPILLCKEGNWWVGNNDLSASR